MVKIFFIVISFTVVTFLNAAVFTPNSADELYIAIQTANDNDEDDTINLGQNAIYEMNSTVFVIDSNITINGNASILDGNNTSRILSMTSLASLTLDNMTLRNGVDKGAEDQTGIGGAILNDRGTLTANRVLFVDNLAEGGQGTNNGAYAFGGAISNSGDASSMIINSTFSGNRAIGGDGNYSDNGGAAFGSAIFNDSIAEIILQNVTIINNVAQGGTGGEPDPATGGPIGADGVGYSAIFNRTGYGSGTIIIRNSIVAGNIADDLQDCNSDAIWITDFNNLFNGDGSQCHGGSSDLNVDDDASGDLTNVMELTLLDNGGSSYTHALVSGSPAINAGNNNDAPEVDQRGYSRDAHIDIGAYEYFLFCPASVVYLLD